MRSDSSSWFLGRTNKNLSLVLARSFPPGVFLSHSGLDFPTSRWFKSEGFMGVEMVPHRFQSSLRGRWGVWSMRESVSDNWCRIRTRTTWICVSLSLHQTVPLQSCSLFMRMLLISVVLPGRGSRPADTESWIGVRCRKVPKRTADCHYLIFQWVIQSSPPLSLSFSASVPRVPPTLEMCIFKQVCGSSVMGGKNSWWRKRSLSKCSLMLR